MFNVLPFIADRTVFNSIASCNRDTNEKSKSMPPPWPINYQLSASNKNSIAIWSSDGTRVAYTYRPPRGTVITIVDQRHGIIHRIENNHDVDYWNLKFSPDDRFLVSADDDGIVKLWDTNVAGNYEQLHEWNISEDVGEDWLLLIDISACSKYVVIMSAHLLSSNRVILKSIENGETIRSSTPQPVMKYIRKVMFSLDYRTIFVCGRCGNSSVIKLWRPYQDEADEDNLITLWEQKICNYDPKIVVPHDKMIIAIQDRYCLNKGWLLSVDDNYSCTVQKLNIRGNEEMLQFTTDDECIIYTTKNGLKYWSLAEKKFTDNVYVLYNEETNNEKSLCDELFANNRQLIVYDDIKEGNSSLYIKSIF